MTTLAVLTNARATDQRSMTGYGEMLLEAARQTEHEVVEFRPASLLGRLLPERIQGLPCKLSNVHRDNGSQNGKVQICKTNAQEMNVRLTELHHANTQ